MNTAEVVTLGASVAEDGVPVYQATGAADADGNAEDFGKIDVIQALGLAALPMPADSDGAAEGVGLRDCGNADLCIIGARDTRTASVVGNMVPGDTVLHCTHPNLSAQVQLKGSKRQAAMISRHSNGKQLAVILDGENGRTQIIGLGGLAINGTAEDGWVLTAGGSASVQITKEAIVFRGQIQVASSPPGFLLSSPVPVVGMSGTATPVAGFTVSPG